jgi:hypothetical protein
LDQIDTHPAQCCSSDQDVLLAAILTDCDHRRMLEREQDVANGPCGVGQG